MRKAGGIGHITHHVISLQFERELCAVGETALEESEALLSALLALVPRAERGADCGGLSGVGSGSSACHPSRGQAAELVTSV